MPSFEELVASDPRLRAFNDTVPAGILVIRVDDGAVLFANRFFREVLGVDGVKVLGESWSEFFVDPADRERLMVSFAESGVVRNFEVCLKRADGSPLWALVSMASVPIDNEDLLLFAFVDITALKQAEAEIRQLANHDALTGLPSLRLLRERVAQAIARADRDGTQFAVLYVDLDGFKMVNDSLGHDAGDDMLKRAASQMVEQVRKSDTVARIGGDEFVIVVENLDEKAARSIGETIVSRIRQPMALPQGVVNVGASVGVAIYPRHGKNLDAILKSADAAMYRVKTTTKGAVALAE